MTTLSAPRGVTRIACVKAYATKLHISPTITEYKKKKKMNFFTNERTKHPSSQILNPYSVSFLSTIIHLKGNYNPDPQRIRLIPKKEQNELR